MAARRRTSGGGGRRSGGGRTQAPKAKATKKAAPKKKGGTKKKTTPRKPKDPFALTAKEKREIQARSDLGTLQRAQEIKADQARLKAAEAEGKRQVEAVQKVIRSED